MLDSRVHGSSTQSNNRMVYSNLHFNSAFSLQDVSAASFLIPTRTRSSTYPVSQTGAPRPVGFRTLLKCTQPVGKQGGQVLPAGSLTSKSKMFLLCDKADSCKTYKVMPRMAILIKEHREQERCDRKQCLFVKAYESGLFKEHVLNPLAQSTQHPIGQVWKLRYQVTTNLHESEHQ